MAENLFRSLFEAPPSGPKIPTWPTPPQFSFRFPVIDMAFLPPTLSANISVSRGRRTDAAAKLLARSV